MYELVGQVFAYLRGIWQYRWYALLVAWCISVAGWIVVLGMPDQFQSSARVFIDMQSLLKPALGGLALDTSEIQRHQLKLMTRTLLSRPNLEKVARLADLNPSTNDPQQMEVLLKKLAAHIQANPDPGQPELYYIAYTNPDPQAAKRVVETLVSLFVEGNLGSQRQDNQNTQRFLDEQIQQYHEKLRASEKSLEEFKRKNAALMPGEGSNYFSRLQMATAELEQAKLYLAEWEKRRDDLHRQVKDKESLPRELRPATDKRLAAIDARIQALQEKLDEMLVRYTERHPDVQALQANIKDLEEKRREMASSTPVSRATVAEPNIKQQQLELALSDAEAGVASLQVRVQEYEKRVNELKAMVDTVPKIEAEFTNLTRDYDVLRQNYNQLLQRRAAAKLAEEAEQSADTLKFRIVEPPRVPLSPVGPRRPLYLIAVLCMAVGAGAGLALFLALAKPTFDNRRTLAEITGLPVYGAVSMVWTPRQRRRSKLALTGFVAASACLLISYGALLGMLVLFGSPVQL